METVHLVKDDKKEESDKVENKVISKGAKGLRLMLIMKIFFKFCQVFINIKILSSIDPDIYGKQ